MRLRKSLRSATDAPIILLGLLALCAPMEAASAARFTGKIAGLVKSPGGVVQMGATVQLLNRFEKPVMRAITDEHGAFLFDLLSPESYTVRVSLASFVPAMRTNIQIGPGAERFLAIQLASLFSSIEIFYAPPPGSFLMSEDWRSALRGSLATRPILRALPSWDPNPPGRGPQAAKIFSDMRGMVTLSSGDTATNFSWGTQTDLGTAFAVGTSVMKRSQLQFSGNLGYGLASGIPAAGFRTTYQRTIDSVPGFDAPNPQLSLTVRQLFFPMRAGQNVPEASSGAPLLRTISATFADRWQLNDRLLLEYGASMDSVQFFERLNYISPFARATWDGKSIGKVQMAFSSGFPPVDLLIRGQGEDADMQRQVSGLALFPKITRVNGTTRAQRVENFELGYTKKLGSGEVFAAGYREGVSNAGLAVVGAPMNLLGSELVPDLASNASIFNIGGYYRNGYLVGWTQYLPGDWRLSTGFGTGGVLRTDQRALELSDNTKADADAIRKGVYQQAKNFASIRLSGVLPRVGTRLYSSYLWTDYRALTPFHTSLTSQGLAEAGLNIGIKQPIPGFLGLPGRLEINAEMRNMLAQGYVPVTTSTGQTMWLIPTPKQVRGGLSFIF
ncbi:TonB-dependent receptor [Bryobacter aggregatus]|uniref:TonB-dependent receptor n=1 Tax=Bryobacter aggregatus TaxID=360054 RepID=UPI0004E0C1FF|nr:TonB-dependent receptor [Bryobacter aggregatus]